jgi:hypothetical protein
MSNSIGTGFSPSATGKSGWSTGGLGDLAALVAGLGRSIYVNGNPVNGPLLGGGFKGRMPQPIMDHDNSEYFARTRFTLRDAWNTTSRSGSSYDKRIITPFRAVNNAGDILSRQEYSCGGTCQTPQSRPNVKGLRTRFGSISVSCIPSVLYSTTQINPNVPASACNVKYVYDGSDYTSYLKLKAINKNYNDLSFGGNNYSGAQSVIRAIRRY